MMTRLVKNLIRLLKAPEPERSVPLWWLLRNPSKLDRRFKEKAKVRVSEQKDFQEVWINGELLLWPKGATIDSLLQISSELQTPTHPNQYLWGPTTIKPGDVTLDIGACEGSFSAQASRLGARCIVVEPSKTMTKLIREMFLRRGLEQPLIANHLLGPAPGVAHFLEARENPGQSRVLNEPVENSYPVEILSLDQLIEKLALPRVDFIKCDAEGADVDIIKSGAEVLKKFKPKLAICTYHNDDDFSALHAFLRPFGYVITGKGFLHAAHKFRIVMLHAC